MSEFLPAAPLSQIPAGRGLTVRLAERDIALLREGETVYALDNACPHKGAALSFGWVENGRVACPMHGWEFECRTGACTDRPNVTVRHYEVKVEDGMVLVKVD
jgi:nitrite reductase (NADH) small subunit